MVSEVRSSSFRWVSRWADTTLSVPKQEDKALAQGLGVGQTDGLEAFVNLLMCSFVIQPRLVHGDDHEPQWSGSGMVP